MGDKDILETLNLSEEERHKLLNNKGLSADNLLIPAVYKELFLDNWRYFILSSGRVSGKTSILVALWWVYFNKYEDRDIVILQATATEIKDSIINEIEKFLINSGVDVGDSPTCEYYIPKTHDKIVKKNHQGETRFYPITDSKGGQRSRGINTINKISLVLYEEAQKNKDENVLEQSVITFIRQLDLMAKLVVVGNNETVGHWFVDYVDKKKSDDSWLYIYSNCYDIWNLLNQQTKEYIESIKAANYTEFRRVFLGDINANTSDVVFPQFERKTHYKKCYELEEHYIRYLIIGVDHATADDTFAIVPVAVLDNGTCQTLEICYDDPKEMNRTLSPSEQCEILEKFLDFLNDKYGLAGNHLTTIISVDGAASPFIQQLQHTKRTSKNKTLWKNIAVKGFTLKKKDTDLGIIKNAFAYNVIKILNEGRCQWNGRPNLHRLAHEIEAQRYKNGKLDDKIPNDVVDALEYGLVPYYSNCYNLSFPVRMNEAHYNDIRKFANLK